MIPTEDNGPPSEPLHKGPSFLGAMLCYLAIAIIAGLTLDGKFLWVVWIFLAGLAIKTYLQKLQKP